MKSRHLKKVIIGDSWAALEQSLSENVPLVRTNIHTLNWFEREYREPTEYIQKYLECVTRGLVLNPSIEQVNADKDKKTLQLYNNSSFDEFTYEKAIFYDPMPISRDLSLFFNPHIYKVYWFKVQYKRMHRVFSNKALKKPMKGIEWALLKNEDLYICVSDLYNSYSDALLKLEFKELKMRISSIQFHREFLLTSILYNDTEEESFEIKKENFFIYS